MNEYNISFYDVDQAFINATPLLNVTRKQVPFRWFQILIKQYLFDLIILLKFLNVNKKLLTAKQGKLLIKDCLKNYTSSDRVKSLLDVLRLEQIISVSSFSKIEILQILKDIIHNSYQEQTTFRELIDHYKKKFQDHEEIITFSFCKLMAILKSNIFSYKSDPEIFISFCEMFMNNNVQSLWGSYATRCFQHFSIVSHILYEEKESFFGFDIVFTIVEKIFWKFYCEAKIIPILVNIPIMDVDELEKDIKKLEPICVLYLELLLLSEPRLNHKLISRLEWFDKEIVKDPNYFEKFTTIINHIEIIDKERLSIIDKTIEQLLKRIQILYPRIELYKIKPQYLNWNFPTLSFISKEEMKLYLKESSCDTFHLSAQGYFEFFKLDNKWISTGIKKLEQNYFENVKRIFYKRVIDPDIKFIMGNEKLGTFWGYNCLSEYKDDCNKAKGCNLSLSLDENKERRGEIVKCAIKREVYQYGSISSYESKKVQSHLQQIKEKIDQVENCNDIIFDKT